MDTDLFFGITALIFGAVVGSFLNALSFRWGTGVSIMRGRSHCMQCGHTLSALDLVPVFSYLFLEGRCRYCHCHISAQYPLVEIVGALLSLAVYALYPEAFSYAFWLFVWMLILFCIVYDIRHTVVPWSCSGLLALLTFISLFLNGTPTQSALLAGPILALPLLLLSFLSGGRLMGRVDGVLELSFGWMLGLVGGVTALVLSVWSGAIVGILLLLLSKRVTMKSEIPFVPFLALGTAIIFFLHVTFLQALPYRW